METPEEQKKKYAEVLTLSIVVIFLIFIFIKFLFF